MKKKTKILYYIVAALVVVMLVTMAICGHVLSRYTSTAGYTSNQITVDDFYFTVDLLGDSVDAASSTKEINVYGKKAQDIEFNVRNYFDELRVTESAIEYTITFTSEVTTSGGTGATISITDDSNGAVCSTSGTASTTQTISSSSQSSNKYKLKIANDYTSAETITVTIKSTSPFTKTLTLVFYLIADSTSASCVITDNNSYVELVIKSDVAISTGNATINWPSAGELQFDNTNSFFELDLSNTYNTSAKSKAAINAEESVSVKLFKTSSGTYVVSSCSLSGTSGDYSLAITITTSP